MANRVALPFDFVYSLEDERIGKDDPLRMPSLFETGFACRFSKGCGWAAPIFFGPRIRIFLHGAPPTSVCAAFIKESRVKSANAGKILRKSGVRLGERAAPVRFPRIEWGTNSTTRYELLGPTATGSRSVDWERLRINPPRSRRHQAAQHASCFHPILRAQPRVRRTQVSLCGKGNVLINICAVTSSGPPRVVPVPSYRTVAGLYFEIPGTRIHTTSRYQYREGTLTPLAV